jgi:CSLREA domain-containing protein
MRRNHLLLFALLALLAAHPTQASTITVNRSGDTVADDGNCTLREAITAANTNTASGAMAGECVAGSASGVDTIAFSIFELCPVAGCAINLLSPLPDISTSMSIGPSPTHKIQRSSSASTNFRLFNVTATGTVTFSGLMLNGGIAYPQSGGAIFNVNSGKVVVTNSVFTSNVGFDGAAIGTSAGEVVVTDSAFIKNNAINSGAALSTGSGKLTLTNCSFTENVATTGNGGMLNAGSAAVTITACTMSGNSAANMGGAISYGSGLLTIADTTFDMNTARGHQGAQDGDGGAIHSTSGTLNLTNTTFSNNFAQHIGGAIDSRGPVNVANCTIAGNQAARAAGIYNQGNNSSITNSTITTNSASTSNGGVENEIGAVMKVKSTIIAGNSAASANPDVHGAFASGGFNLIGKADGSTGFTAGTDLKGTIAAPIDPKLDPNGLQNNGGPTKTIALVFGSPAIDTGVAGLDPSTSAVLTTDQRGPGFPRTFEDSIISNAPGGDGTDIGAFELEAALPPRLANISTRLRVETGDGALIGGFIITGTQDKKVMLRAIGPSLPFAGKLENPTLELHGPNGLIEANDNWISSPNRQAIMDTMIPPPDDLESAIIQSLPANNTGYTAIVRGLNNATGIGVVEAYDLDPTVDSQLANISTRGLVQTGDNVLIAGTIVLGNTSQKVIVRALGPSLSLPGKLEDPTLELRNQNGGVLEANDNWVDSPNKQAIMDSGISPSNDKESAIVQILPGNGAGYTAVVHGVNDSTGIAVVEVYALQ